MERSAARHTSSVSSPTRPNHWPNISNNPLVPVVRRLRRVRQSGSSRTRVANTVVGAPVSRPQVPPPAPTTTTTTHTLARHARRGTRLQRRRARVPRRREDARVAHAAQGGRCRHADDGGRGRGWACEGEGAAGSWAEGLCTFAVAGGSTRGSVELSLSAERGNHPPSFLGRAVV